MEEAEQRLILDALAEQWVLAGPNGACNTGREPVDWSRMRLGINSKSRSAIMVRGDSVSVITHR
jgi:hypothetical protein